MEAQFPNSPVTGWALTVVVSFTLNKPSAGTLMGGLDVHLRDIQEAFGHSSAKMDAALFGDRATDPEPKRIETTIETSMGRITCATNRKDENPSRNSSRC